jgi:pyruvate dehydrogenase E2 component (dihydrolipoamide acetyltransferase)
MAKMTLKIPKGAVSMREGTIVAWKVGDGERVAVGQPLYDIETEKTTMEVGSPFEGVIRILEQAGRLLPVGHPIAEIQT